VVTYCQGAKDECDLTRASCFRIEHSSTLCPVLPSTSEGGLLEKEEDHNRTEQQVQELQEVGAREGEGGPLPNGATGLSPAIDGGFGTCFSR
jgi:hypothetical protein